MNPAAKPTPWDLCHRCSSPHGYYKMVRFDDGVDEYDAYICKSCADSPDVRIDRLETHVRVLSVLTALLAVGFILVSCHH
ncbi:MAG TPA: hypothetical protein VFA29_12305 [Candidatus Baltobacteraceae bacterium]|nr:hypothetical protein [Candidatus Baltobacteraceae bacterium]